MASDQYYQMAAVQDQQLTNKLQAIQYHAKTGYLEQLTLLFDNGPTWDGDLISKTHRDELVKAGFAERVRGGWNIITKAGVECLVDLGIARS